MSKPPFRTHSSFRRLHFESLESRLALSASPVASGSQPLTVDASSQSVADATTTPKVQIETIEFHSEVVDSASQTVTEFEPGREYVLRIHSSADLPVESNSVQQLFMEIEFNEGVELRSSDSVKYTGGSNRASESSELQARTVIADVEPHAFRDSRLLAEIPFTMTGDSANAMFKATPYFLISKSPSFFAISESAAAVGTDNISVPLPVFELPLGIAETDTFVPAKVAPSVPPLTFLEPVEPVDTPIAVSSAELTPAAPILDHVSSSEAATVHPTSAEPDPGSTGLKDLLASPVVSDEPIFALLDPDVVASVPIHSPSVDATLLQGQLVAAPKVYVPRAAAHAVVGDPLEITEPSSTDTSSRVDLQDLQRWDSRNSVDAYFENYHDRYRADVERNHEREKTLELLLIEFGRESETVQDPASSNQWSWNPQPKLPALSSAKAAKSVPISDVLLFDELSLDWGEIMENRIETFEPESSLFRMQSRVFSTSAKTDDQDVATFHDAASPRDEYQSIDIAQVLHAPASKTRSRPVREAKERRETFVELDWEQGLQGEQRIAIIWDQASSSQAPVPPHEPSAAKEEVQQEAPSVPAAEES